MQAELIYEGHLSARISSIRWVRLNRKGQRHGVAFTSPKGRAARVVNRIGDVRVAWSERMWPDAGPELNPTG
jgi:hypothetical protein